MSELTLRRGALRFRARTSGFERNPEGPLVLLLHGFPDDEGTFRHQLPALAEAGFRAVAPRMRGYEPSSQPEDGDYRVETLARDVLAWLDELGAPRAHLFGHDWGAVVTYAAAALAPERFERAVTLAVPPPLRLARAIARVPRQLALSWYTQFFQLPALPELALARGDGALLRHLWSAWSPGFHLAPERWASLRETFEAPGVHRAMLAYYRQNLSPRALRGWTSPEARALRRVPVPTLALTGAQDGCMDTRLWDHAVLAEDFPAGVRVERLEGAGHFAHLERPEALNQLLLGWLEGRAA